MHGKFLSMHTAFLCYAQSLNNRICTAYEYLRQPFSVTHIRILPVNKIIKDLRQNQFIANFIYIHKKVFCATSTRPFGEVGGCLLYNFHCKHILLKLKIKKLLRKISSKKLTRRSFKKNIIVYVKVKHCR